MTVSLVQVVVRPFLVKDMFALYLNFLSVDPFGNPRPIPPVPVSIPAPARAPPPPPPGISPTSHGNASGPGHAPPLSSQRPPLNPPLHTPRASSPVGTCTGVPKSVQVGGSWCDVKLNEQGLRTGITSPSPEPRRCLRSSSSKLMSPRTLDTHHDDGHTRQEGPTQHQAFHVVPRCSAANPPNSDYGPNPLACRTPINQSSTSRTTQLPSDSSESGASSPLSTSNFSIRGESKTTQLVSSSSVETARQLPPLGCGSVGRLSSALEQKGIASSSLSSSSPGVLPRPTGLVHHHTKTAPTSSVIDDLGIWGRDVTSDPACCVPHLMRLLKNMGAFLQHQSANSLESSGKASVQQSCLPNMEDKLNDDEVATAATGQAAFIGKVAHPCPSQCWDTMPICLVGFSKGVIPRVLSYPLWLHLLSFVCLV
jgi:hypothetical protein